jgi:hypothetical protein
MQRKFHRISPMHPGTNQLHAGTRTSQICILERLNDIMVFLVSDCAVKEGALPCSWQL